MHIRFLFYSCLLCALCLLYICWIRSRGKRWREHWSVFLIIRDRQQCFSPDPSLPNVDSVARHNHILFMAFLFGHCSRLDTLLYCLYLFAALFTKCYDESWNIFACQTSEMQLHWWEDASCSELHISCSLVSCFSPNLFGHFRCFTLLEMFQIIHLFHCTSFHCI